MRIIRFFNYFISKSNIFYCIIDIRIATEDGLNRYNGYEFKQYKYDEYDENSIINNYILDITEDKNGHIWISSANGLSRINTDKNEIKNYYSKKYNGSLFDSNLWRILVTKDSYVLVFGLNGVNLYDEKNDTFTNILSKQDDSQSQFIYSVEEDSNGHIWIGTDTGLVELDKNLKLIKSYEDTIWQVGVHNTYDDSNGNL